MYRAQGAMENKAEVNSFQMHNASLNQLSSPLEGKLFSSYVLDRCPIVTGQLLLCVSHFPFSQVQSLISVLMLLLYRYRIDLC